MEQFKSLAIDCEPFDPPYTENFKRYLENSIAESRKADIEANRTAAKIRII